MKNLARNISAAILGSQVRRLIKKNHLKVIGVVGGIGKTSTKLAIANVLSAKYRVQRQEGNYNHLVTAPLVFFGEQLPGLRNPLAWLALFWRNELKIFKPYSYDIVVLELGTDGPGQITEFKSYLNLEIGIVTALVPEHMEFFGSMDAVAKEELTISEMSSLLLVSKDFCDDKYLKNLGNVLTYGINKPANYMLNVTANKLAINSGKEVIAETDNGNRSQAELYSLLAASAVAHKMGLSVDEIKKGIGNVKPVPGRMQKLAGINNSIIIDDTYNSSPEAVKLALNTLYKMIAPQKIAVLGNMNELGEQSAASHREIGELCDPKQLSLVATIGPDANEYLAAAAEAKGCKVQRFDSPYQIAEFLKPLIKEKAVILAKGSQNKVFVEEAVKGLLADPADAQKLVRQSDIWLRKKQDTFKQ